MLSTYLHYLMTDQDARILVPIMLVLTIFSVWVIGRAVRRAVRPRIHRRREVKRLKAAPPRAAEIKGSRPQASFRDLARAFGEAAARRQAAEPNTEPLKAITDQQKVGAS